MSDNLPVGLLSSIGVAHLAPADVPASATRSSALLVRCGERHRGPADLARSASLASHETAPDLYSRRLSDRPWPYSILLLVVALSALSAPPATAREKKLRLVSYNVQFLPLIARGFNKRSNVSYRARAIVAHLADTADIIGFNEVFDYQARALLIGGFKKAWGASFHHVVHPKGSNRINGGLLIVSRYPLVATHALHFRAASRFRDHGLAADGLVSKGVQHAAVRLSASLTIDLFATHLEARSEQARQAQYTELAQFIHKYGSSRRPSVLIGDFNTSGGEKEMARKGSAYQVMMRALRDTRNHDPMVDLWPKLNKRIIGTSNQLTDDGGRRIDYIMAAIPRSAQERFKPTALSVRQHRDAKVAALSNHSAVHCIFTWQAAP